MNAWGNYNNSRPFSSKTTDYDRCNTSDEMHHTRHKEILIILREINAYDQANFFLDSQLIRRKDGAEKKRGDSETTSEATDAISEISFEEETLTRRERKKAKKLGARNRRNIEVYSQEELNNISEALHGQVHESKGAWEGTYAYENRRVETSLTGSEAVEDDDEDCDPYAVQPAIQASNKGYKTPNFPTPKQQRAAKKSATTTGFKQAKLRGHQQKLTLDTAYNNDPYAGLEPDIFYRLGIDVNLLPNPKARKDLVRKLIVAIENDLQVIRREEEEAAIREEGFWRWAGRSAYRNILEYRKTFDWATGQKITSMKTEAEIFGEELDDEHVDETEEKAEDCEDTENEGEAAVDEIIATEVTIAQETIQDTLQETVQYHVEETDDTTVDKKEQDSRKEVRVLKITTAYESRLKHKPRPTKTIAKVSLGKKKQAWKCVEAEGFIDDSVDQENEMAQGGLHDLVKAYGNSSITNPKPASWAAVVGYASDGTTTTVKRSKKVNTNNIVLEQIEEDEWTTVTKKGKKN